MLNNIVQYCATSSRLRISRQKWKNPEYIVLTISSGICVSNIYLICVYWIPRPCWLRGWLKYILKYCNSSFIVFLSNESKKSVRCYWFTRSSYISDLSRIFPILVTMAHSLWGPRWLKEGCRHNIASEKISFNACSNQFHFSPKTLE